MKRFRNFILNPLDTNVHLDIFAMVLLLTNLFHLAKYFPSKFFFRSHIIHNEILRLNFKLWTGISERSVGILYFAMQYLIILLYYIFWFVLDKFACLFFGPRELQQSTMKILKLMMHLLVFKNGSIKCIMGFAPFSCGH